MSIESELAAFEKTPEFKRLVEEKIKSDKGFKTKMLGNSANRDFAQKMSKRMVSILHEKLAKIQNTQGESFLDKLLIKVNFDEDKGWYVDISFDKDEMHRDSLYPEGYPNGADISILFNEGYKAKNFVYGLNKSGERIKSKISREGLFFIQESVEEFNTEQNGKAVAEYSADYSGGTLI